MKIFFDEYIDFPQYHTLESVVKPKQHGRFLYNATSGGAASAVFREPAARPGRRTQLGPKKHAYSTVCQYRACCCKEDFITKS